MKNKFINFVALDLGSSKIAALASYIDKKGETEIAQYCLRSSKGIRGGAIIDFKLAQDCIIESIYELEKICSKNISEVAISIAGLGTKSYYLSCRSKLQNQKVTNSDIKKLIQKTLAEFKGGNLEIIQYFPFEFKLDGNVVDSPVGMFGRELSCRLHLIVGENSLIANITNCFAKYQIEILSIELSIYAAAQACLSLDEKNLGSIIIDMGAHSTCLGIFKDGKLIYTDAIAIGSWHITSDIAKIFAVSLKSAEKLKVIYGSAISASFDANASINLEDLESDNLYNVNSIIPLRDLAMVIESRLEEILNSLKKIYNNSSMTHLVGKRLILAGGGSSLRGAREVASKIFEMQTRLGRPSVYVSDKNFSLSTYSSVLGLTQNYALKQQKKSLEIEIINSDTNWFKKLLVWLKDNL